MPALSIITINYNNRSGLEKTILSVVSQTFKDFEFIIIDGGSKDGSAELLNAHASTITYSVSEKDTGIYNAQNKGIKNAIGDYLLFLNSGDFLCDKHVLENVFSRKLDQDIIYGNMLINWGNKAITQGKMPDTITKEHLFKDTLWHPVSFIKKILFDKYGMYNEKYKLVADYDFFFKVIIQHQVSTKHIDVFICEFNMDGQSSKAENKLIEKQERRLVQESYLTTAEIKQLESKLQNELGFFTRVKKLIKGN